MAPDSPVPAGHPTDRSLSDVIEHLERGRGSGQFRAVGGDEGASIECLTCRRRSPAEAHGATGIVRLEGASDPDDMVAVVMVGCPFCHAEGSLVLHYGPESALEEADVLVALDRSSREPDPASEATRRRTGRAAEPGSVGPDGTEVDHVTELTPAIPPLAPGRAVRPLVAVAMGVAVTGAALVGSRIQRRPSTRVWYSAMPRPRLQPPDAVFGLVWSTLYPAIAWSGYRVFTVEPSPAQRRARAAWIAEMATNAAWTPLFFGAHRPDLALGDLVATVAATASLRTAARDVAPETRPVLGAYLGWLGFATYLNAASVAEVGLGSQSQRQRQRQSHRLARVSTSLRDRAARLVGR